MIAAIDRLVLCFGHNLNLAFTNALKNVTRVTRTIGVCKIVVQHLAHSWKKGGALLRHKLQKGCLSIPLLLIVLLGRDHNTK